ncbi:hypothetical protein IRJ41_014657 [Triplophysa rosa]|uniref:Uncharacterized protein n=1 Tax=Triplophysa rosa TaxID=992332 RepID=A0A9W7TL53_TRIRA|nr:hypothetical protein IRJ41_014657 [Triplophysa rosa]
MMTHHFADKSADCCVTALVLGECQRSGYRRRVFFFSQTQCGTARRLEWRHRSSHLQSTGLFRGAPSSGNAAPLLFGAQGSFPSGGAAEKSTAKNDKRSKTNSRKTWIYAPSQDINRSFGEASSDHIFVCLLLHTCTLNEIPGLRSRREWFGFKSVTCLSHHKPASPPMSGRLMGPSCFDCVFKFWQGGHSASRLRQLRSPSPVG